LKEQGVDIDRFPVNAGAEQHIVCTGDVGEAGKEFVEEHVVGDQGQG
jgi:hypothetical protein